MLKICHPGTSYVTGNWGNTGRLTLRELHVHVTTGYTEDSPPWFLNYVEGSMFAVYDICLRRGDAY